MTEPTAPAGQRTVRLHNLRLVLGELSVRPGSRAELAQRTGLTKATISSLVDGLISQAVLLEADPAATGPGRPSRILSFHPDGPVSIGVEINVDYTAIQVLDLTGRIRFERREIIDNRGRSKKHLLGRVARLCELALAGQSRPPLGVALAVPAAVSPDGVVLRAPNLPVLNGHPLGADLARLLGGSPVWTDNEANYGALAQLRTVPGDGQDFVFVSGEIGVGAGLVVDGQLFHGFNGFGGELGHVVVERDGPACGCGGRGCVEQYAGQEVLLAAAAQPDVDALRAALDRGDQRAITAVRQAGAALGVGLASLLNVVDLPVVVLSGLYARLFDVLQEPVQQALRERALSTQWGGGHVRCSALTTDAAVRGAAWFVTDQALHDPTRLMV
jgi:predicted NBD/HSP70 family sugar kinase